MARLKEKTLIAPDSRHESTNGDESLQPIAFNEDNDLLQLAELLRDNEMDGGEVEVFRRRPADKGYNYLDKIPAGQFGIEDIKRQYGGGEYRCKLKRANGQFFKSITFAIDMQFRGAMETAAVPGASGPVFNLGNDGAIEKLIAALAPAKGGGDTQLLLAIMQQNNQMQMAMMQSMTQMMVAAMNRKGGGGMGEELTPVIVKMLETQRPDTIGELSKLMRVARELGGDAPKESGGAFDKLLDFAAPVLAGVLSKATLPAPAPAPALRNVVDLPPAPPPSQSPEDMQKLLITQLLAAAAKNEDVVQWADALDAMIPEDKADAFAAILRLPNWVGMVFGERASEAQQYLPWLEKLRAELLNPSTPAE